MIEDSNLTVGDVRAASYSDTVEEGMVISTDPPAGTELKRDEAVHLVVSRGVAAGRRPERRRQAGRRGPRRSSPRRPLGAKVEEKFNDTVPAGEVISQQPAKGKAPKNSDVALVVSKGPPLVPVPDVVGKNVAEAQAILTAAGFGARFNLPGGPDRVLNQSPNGGGTGAQGSRVTLSVF